MNLLVGAGCTRAVGSEGEPRRDGPGGELKVSTGSGAPFRAFLTTTACVFTQGPPGLPGSPGQSGQMGKRVSLSSVCHVHHSPHHQSELAVCRASTVPTAAAERLETWE